MEPTDSRSWVSQHATTEHDLAPIFCLLDLRFLSELWLDPITAGERTKPCMCTELAMHRNVTPEQNYLKSARVIEYHREANSKLTVKKCPGYFLYTC